MENVALHRIKSNTSPKCEVPLGELGTNAGRKYNARDHARHWEEGNRPRSPTSESDNAQVLLDTTGTTIGQNIFYGLHHVLAPDLYKPDMLYMVYLGFFKHMMD